VYAVTFLVYEIDIIVQLYVIGLVVLIIFQILSTLSLHIKFYVP